MNWPSPQDFNDAIRHPKVAFADPDLAAGDLVVGSDGRPRPWPGDSSNVYQVCAADDRSWAVKCFTRPVPALGFRYARIQEALEQAAAPFAAGFLFLEEGIRVGEQWYPVLKMDWVEGLPLNKVARDQAANPAVLEAIFQQWMQMCRDLRKAGVAHTDLNHGHILLVPGARPEEFTLKLIDYDGMYVPALPSASPAERGHTNYQHPARTAEWAQSADLDRFPLLVIATALKGLSVLGPSLWQRYDSGDNLLFTAADFRDPAASPLMRELLQADDPTLRMLVWNLSLACGRPIPQTPWLDELVPESSAAKPTVVKSRGTVVPTVPKPVEVLSLDDAPANDEPPPRKRSQPEADFARLLFTIVAGFLLLAVGVFAGVFMMNREKTPEETAQFQAEPPIESVAPAPTPAVPKEPAPAAPAITPPAVEPPPQPAPVVAGPPGFHKVWAKPPGPDQLVFARPFFAADGKRVFISSSKSIEQFNAKTGEPLPELHGPGTSNMDAIWQLDGDRIALTGTLMKIPLLFDLKTGESLGPLLAQSPLESPPAGVGSSNIEYVLSPGKRYLFAGYRAPIRDSVHTLAPYRVIEMATGRVVAQGDWAFGSVRFTADSSRMLMAEGNGRVRWMKVPSGEVEIEWAFQPVAQTRAVLSMSADGSLIVYRGKPPGLPLDNYLIDGKTGQVLRRIGIAFGSTRGVLSADGKWFAGITYEPPDIRRCSIVLTDARTGDVLVRTPLDGDTNSFQWADFTPDGKALFLQDRKTREYAVYELRGDVPAAQVAGRIPAPLGPIPERVKPGTPVAGAIDIAPPMPQPKKPDPAAPIPKRPDLPAAPALKARLTRATETGIMANQLPQLPLYSQDGRTIVLSGGTNGTILTFDANTLVPGAAYDGHKGPGGVLWLSPYGDRVASGGFDGKQATWETKTGKLVDDVKFAELPPLPAGQAGHAGLTYAVSSSGRYTAIARKESIRGVAGPLRVLDTTTGQVIVSTDWNGGQIGGYIGFVADESRMFVLNGLGKMAWYKLPSGEVDGEWRAGGAGVQAETAKILGMAADGHAILYYGSLGVNPTGAYLLDGKTGRILHKLNSSPYQASRSALSPDGKYVAMGVIDYNHGSTWQADVFEVATWKLVGRIAPPELSAKEHAQFGFSPDGKDLAVFYPKAKELSVFALPGGGPVAIAPAIPDPPRVGDAPALKASWSAAAGVGRAAVPIRYDPDAQRLILAYPAAQTVAAFDARTGRPAPEKLDGLRWSGLGDLFLLPSLRLGFHYRTDQSITVWDLKAGKAGDPIPVPDLPLGPDRRNHRSVWLSPDGKFMAVARNATPQAAAPLRIFELATGKAAVSTDWTGGTVHFTADASRALVNETGGPCRWYKLPSGEADGEWNLPKPGPGGQTAKITCISADGRLVGYTGPAIGANGPSVAVLDGKTGEVVRAFGPEYLSHTLTLSADGRLAAVVRNPAAGADGFAIDLVDVKTGRIVGQVKVQSGRLVPSTFLTPDGKALVVHDYWQERVHWFELPEQAK